MYLGTAAHASVIPADIFKAMNRTVPDKTMGGMFDLWLQDKVDGQIAWFTNDFGRLTAWALCCKESVKDDAPTFVVYVLPSYRRHGLGTQLLMAIAPKTYNYYAYDDRSTIFYSKVAP